MEKTPALPENIQKTLSKVAQDEVHGASALFLEVLGIFPALVAELPREKHAARHLLLEVAKAVAASQPHMAPFHQLSDYFENLVAGNFEPAVMINALRAFPMAVERMLRKHQQRIVAAALEIAAPWRRIMVHSHSGLVESFLRAWLPGDSQNEVWITESRPANEGVNLARALKILNRKVKVLVDDARHLALAEVDAVVLGADRVSENEFINKIGSYSLVSLARELGKPVTVLAEFIKFFPAAKISEKKRGSQDRAEILLEDGLARIEFLFESTPLCLVDFLVTPQGIVAPDAVPKLFESGKWRMLAG